MAEVLPAGKAEQVKGHDAADIAVAEVQLRHLTYSSFVKLGHTFVECRSRSCRLQACAQPWWEMV